MGLQSFVVVSGSMEPDIPLGSIVLTQKQSNLKTGDIIAFKDSEARTVTHRIAQIVTKNGTDYFQTKGDFNNSPDSNLISEGAVIGQEIFQIPYLGRVSFALKTLPGFILLLGLPVLMFIIFEIKAIKEELEKEIEKKLRREIESNIQTSKMTFEKTDTGFEILNFG